MSSPRDPLFSYPDSAPILPAANAVSHSPTCATPSRNSPYYINDTSSERALKFLPVRAPVISLFNRRYRVLLRAPPPYANAVVDPSFPLARDSPPRGACGAADPPRRYRGTNSRRARSVADAHPAFPPNAPSPWSHRHPAQRRAPLSPATLAPTARDDCTRRYPSFERRRASPRER